MENIIPPPSPRNRQSVPILGLHLTAAELSESAFNAWLQEPVFQTGFRQVYAMGGSSLALCWSATWIAQHRHAA